MRERKGERGSRPTKVVTRVSAITVSRNVGHRDASGAMELKMLSDASDTRSAIAIENGGWKGIKADYLSGVRDISTSFSSSSTRIEAPMRSSTSSISRMYLVIIATTLFLVVLA